MSDSFDAVDLGILWSRLVSCADEMVSALVRTSFSTMVRESGDYSCMLFDADGRLLAQGTNSVPSFTGTGPATLAGLLAVVPPESLEDGDVLITNDPWIGTGHTFDINVAKPLFYRGRLVGFALSVSHLADIGGLGYGTGARDVYEEGICIPPVKLFRAGQADEFLMRLFESNVRYREMVLGDIYSNVAACNVAARAVEELLGEYGLTSLAPVADGVLAMARSSIEQALDELPKGNYPGALVVEGVLDEEPLELKVSVEITRAGFHFDFAGNPPVVDFGINVPLCYTRAYCNFCFKSIVAPLMPNNQAILDFVSIEAPGNCILNALRPYPTGGRHVLGHMVGPLIFGALEPVIPEAVQADSGMIFQLSLRGRTRDGRDVSSLLFSAGGYGAFSDLDGRSALPGPSNMIGNPIELVEESTGVTFLRKELWPDSGGAGRHQGGAGQQIEMRNDTGQPLDTAFFGTRTSIPARGFAGGERGQIRRIRIDGEPVVPKSRVDLPDGSVISYEDAGGGGFGPPAERDPQHILQNYVDGFVTEAYIRKHYPRQHAKLFPKDMG